VTEFKFPDDIFTEPEPDPDTLANLGPLGPLAGRWLGEKGVDVHPVADGSKRQVYVETWDFEPIDAATNGPQLFYGLRYHQHVVKPRDVAAFHDQVGYLLWEPERSRVIMTLAIPRAQVAMATGGAAEDATTFTLRLRGRPALGHLEQRLPRLGVPYPDVDHHLPHRPRRPVDLHPDHAARGAGPGGLRPQRRRHPHARRTAGAQPEGGAGPVLTGHRPPEGSAFRTRRLDTVALGACQPPSARTPTVSLDATTRGPP